jgi:hypothetical protein
MRLRSLGLIITAALLAALVVPSVGAAATDELEAKLKGINEPSGGDPDGKGDAAIEINAKKEKLCFVLTYRRIETPIAAHIHEGPKGVDGGIVVPLEEGAFPSGSDGCIKDVKKSLLKDIIADPKGYYVNLHTDDFPGGAIRGQLRLVGD